jgi:SAM-dependent methyltransferase
MQGDAADPPLADGSFDVVLARHILFLLPDPDRVIERWTRLLNPGGALVLVEGFWGTGSGLRSDDLVALVGRHRSEVHLRQLAGEPLLWGKAVHDERYLIHSPA